MVIHIKKEKQRGNYKAKLKLNLGTKINLIVLGVVLLFSLVVGTVIIQQVSNRIEEFAVEKARGDLEFAYRYIEHKYPGEWAIKNEKLYKGSTIMNGKLEVVDEIGKDTGNTVTIFQEDTRISTNVTKDGRRIIGTKVSSKVGNTVLKKGQNYYGEAEVLGSRYQTAYMPIKDYKGEVIGIFHVGASQKIIDQINSSFLKTFTITLIAVILIASLTTLWFTRKLKKRLSLISNALSAAGKGDFTTEVLDEAEDELSNLVNDYNSMRENLHNMICELLQTSEQVAVSSEELTADTEQTNKETGTVVQQTARENGPHRINKIDKTDIGELFERFYEMIHTIQEFKTDLQLKEEQLKEQKEFLRKVIDMNPSYIYAIDKAGTFTLVNESLAKFLGTKTEHLSGAKINDFKFKAESNIVDDFKEMEETREGLGRGRILIEEEFKDNKGNTRWVETVILPILSPQHEVEQLLFVSTDITERTIAEKLLRKSEKLAVVGELAAGVAHEIRNPLTSINGFMYLLKEDYQKDPTYIEIMESELERINFITNEFLTLGKPQVMNFQQKDISVLLESVRALLDTKAALHNVNMTLEFEPTIPFLYCDKNQLKQVFINIIKNAIEAMPNGGEVKVEARIQENNLVVQVADQGHGIPQDRMAKLGEPFYSSKEKGIGLGLMISYKIIEAHNGEINIESEIEKGTIVSVKLPIL